MVIITFYGTNTIPSYFKILTMSFQIQLHNNIYSVYTFDCNANVFLNLSLHVIEIIISYLPFNYNYRLITLPNCVKELSSYSVNDYREINEPRILTKIADLHFLSYV